MVPTWSIGFECLGSWNMYQNWLAKSTMSLWAWDVLPSLEIPQFRKGKRKSIYIYIYRPHPQLADIPRPGIIPCHSSYNAWSWTQYTTRELQEGYIFKSTSLMYKLQRIYHTFERYSSLIFDKCTLHNHQPIQDLRILSSPQKIFSWPLAVNLFPPPNDLSSILK